MHIAESRAWFDEYNYRDFLQARAIEGIVIKHFVTFKLTVDVMCTKSFLPLFYLFLYSIVP